MRSFKIPKKYRFKSKYGRRTPDDDLKSPQPIKVINRITEQTLLELGFVKKLNIWMGKGLSIQKIRGNNAVWKASKGMMKEVDLTTVEELHIFIDEYGNRI